MALPFFGKKSAPVAEKQEPVISKELPAVNNSMDLSTVESLADALGIHSSLAGPVVTPESSMKLSIVYACTRLISGAIAQMNVPVYETVDGERKKVPGHTVADLLNLQPTAIFSAATFWEFIVTCMLLHGDGLAVILRNRNGEPLEILPISPFDWRNAEVDGRLQYYVQLNGMTHGFDQDDVLHFPGFGFNGLRSMSVIKWGASQSIGLQLAMEEYSGDFFNNGANQSYAVVKSGKWDSEQQQQFREAWASTYGGVSSKKYPLTVANGMDIKALSVNGKDAQLLESREFQITDTARAFGLPSFMVNQEQKSTSWGSGLSEIGLGFVRFTLMPHINRFEQEINRKLFMGSRFFVEFNTSSLMRGTLKERNESYRQSIGGSQGPGWMTANEIRRMENLPKINNPKYDELYDPRSAAITSQDEGTNDE